MNINPEMVKSGIRSVVIGVGFLGAGLLIGKGWITQDTWDAFASGPVASLIVSSLVAGVWGIVDKRESRSIAVAKDIAEKQDTPLKALIMEPTRDGHDQAAALSSPAVAVAGTAKAAEIATR